MNSVSASMPFPDIDWYREIVKGAPETILIIDPDCIIRFHNDQAEGMDPTSFVGRSIFEFFLPEYHRLVREKIDLAIRTGEMQTYELASTYQDTPVRWYMTRVGPIFRDGQVVALSLFIRNTTELKQVQEELRQFNDVLEQRVEERTHALNTYARRLEASERLNAALRKSKNWQKAFEILAGHSLKVLSADQAGVYQMSDENLTLSISLKHGEPPPAKLSQQQDRVFYRLLTSNKVRFVVLEDAPEPGCEFCNFIHRQNMQVMLIAPLRAGESLIGVLYLVWRMPRSFSADDESLINAFVESGSNTLHRILVTEQLEKNIRQRESELNVLYEIMSLSGNELDPEKLLQKSLRITVAAVTCCTGIIHLFDPVQKKLKVTVRENCTESLYTWLLLSGLAHDLWENVSDGGQAVEFRRLQAQSYPETVESEVTTLTYLGVPIRSKDTTLGVLSLFSEYENLLEADVKQWVSAIADQIGLALESTYRRRIEKEALILEERQRLARELHDSVSQSLYGLVLTADVCYKLLKLKSYSKLAETLVNIGDVAHQSLKEMRLMLFELRPLSLEAVGLVGALEMRLNTVERRAKVEIDLQVRGAEFIPTHLELELYRIATEALNNSLKHSRATSMNVRLFADPDLFQLEIGDNGKGFDTTKKGSGGIGLQSMQERAGRIHGNLKIESIKGSGTRICLAVPLKNDSLRSQENLWEKI